MTNEVLEDVRYLYVQLEDTLDEMGMKPGSTPFGDGVMSAYAGVCDALKAILDKHDLTIN